jgi:hypothetical protein
VKCETKPIAAERAEMGAGRQGREAPGATDCAKRTQFGQPPRAAGGEMCKTKPIGRSFKFEVSSVKQEKPTAGSSNFTLYTLQGLPVSTNKANSLRAPGSGRGAARRPCRHRRVETRKTNPIPGGAGWDGATGASAEGAIVQNEPNLACRLKAAEGEMCKTNPIWRTNRAKRTQFQGAGRADARVGRTNKANPLRAPGNGRGAARSPCRRRVRACETNPISRSPVGAQGRLRETKPIGRRLSRQTKPIRDSPAGIRGPIMQNEPNFGELADGRNTHHSAIPSFHIPARRGYPRPSASSDDSACRCHPALPLLVWTFTRIAGGHPGGLCLAGQ